MNKKFMHLLLLIVVSIVNSQSLAQDESSSSASNRDKVIALYEALAGVSPSNAEVNHLLPIYSAGNHQLVAQKIVDGDTVVQNMGSFYNVTVKNFAAPWSNEEASTLVPLNDMIATVIGFTRDEDDFHTALYEDVVYKANGSTFAGAVDYYTYSSNGSYPNHPAVTEASSQPSVKCAGVTTQSGSNQVVFYQNPENPNDPNDRGCRNTKYTLSQLNSAKIVNSLYIPHLDTIISTNLIKNTNDHYLDMENQALNLGDPLILKKSSQLVKLHQYPDAISGLLTTRGYGVFYSAGTNRAAFAYSMKNFFCKEMEELQQVVSDFRIRRDVDRSPGGDSSIFQNKCQTCHGGMDAMAGAFAYYNFENGALLYTPQVVHSKMNHNVTFADGFVTQSDSWINLWNEGQNASLGWGEQASGNGVKSLAQMFSQSDQFNTCMSKRVADAVCFKVAKVIDSEAYAEIINTNAAAFKNGGNLKQLFINNAIACTEQL